MRNGSSAIDSYHMRSSMNRGNRESITNMSFEDRLRSLKPKFDYIMLKTQLDTIMHILEQKKNVNAFNSNHVIYNLCKSYHTIYTCM